MVEARDSISATAKSAAPWVALLLLVVAAGLAVNDESMRLKALRTVLVLMAAAEGMAGFMYVFRARRMAERAGRPYAPAYHGVMQDFGFYNLAMALLLALCALEPGRNIVVLRATMRSTPFTEGRTSCDTSGTTSAARPASRLVLVVSNYETRCNSSSRSRACSCSIRPRAAEVKTRYGLCMKGSRNPLELIPSPAR